MRPFSGLPEGSSFTLGNTDFTISYSGGTGNDVVLHAIPFIPATLLATISGGIVTGIKSGTSGGFFIQEPDATIDANANTSEGIFVFTGATVPAAASTR